MKKISKNFVKKIREFFKGTKDNPQKKATLKLVVMFFFFLFLIICARISSHSSSSVKNNQYQSFSFQFDLIEKGNYHFEYIESINANSHTYIGDRNNEIEQFNDGVEYFYKNGEKYFKLENNTWKDTQNPYIFSEFLNIENIKEILNRSMLLSKTEYREGNHNFTYQVSTTTLQDIINHKQIDIEDIPNEIMITTDSQNNVIEMNFKLDSYVIYNHLGALANANIKYSKFGEIEKIETIQ